MRVRSSLAGAILAVAAWVAPAAAHEGNPNYRSEITLVQPPVAGLTVDVVNFDDSLEVRNDTGETVVVVGYGGEPYARIRADGTVEVNLNSKSFYLNQDRFGESEVPARLDDGAPPDWRVANESGEYAWHDHRIHYMGQGTPAQVEDESERTEIFDYRVPLRVGGQPVNVLGTLYWVGAGEGPSPVPLISAIAVGGLALTGAAVLVIRRRRRSSEDRGPREAW
jgi:hypothetical protein